MVIRIRYMDRYEQAEGETVVEAGNPTEAMVKFRCTQDADNLMVTSVCCEDCDDEAESAEELLP
ncbi:MAG: hypothetical protein GXY38_11705 [Planctomycetes bacterium]|jgi:hypothetical protein|nr:hypothetical protein [Planctomycetota bacterium]